MWSAASFNILHFGCNFAKQALDAVSYTHLDVYKRQPFAALAFKIATDPFVGKLAYFRVYSGKVEAGTTVYNLSLIHIL